MSARGFVLPCFTLAALLAGSLAMGQPADRQGRRGLERIKALDANQDNVIEKSEVPEADLPIFERHLKRADRNGDGKLQSDEWRRPQSSAAERRGQGRQRPATQPEANEEDARKSVNPSNRGRGRGRADQRANVENAPGLRRADSPRAGQPANADEDREKDLMPAQRDATRPGPAARLARINEMDTDLDGKVSREEFKGPERAFDMLDGDSDGFLTEKDAEIRESNRPGQGLGPGGGRGAMGRRPGGAPPDFRPGDRPGAGFGRFLGPDGEPTGSITRKDFRGPPALFDRLDTNGDGTIDATERQAMRDRMGGFRDGQGPRGPRPGGPGRGPAGRPGRGPAGRPGGPAPF